MSITKLTNFVNYFEERIIAFFAAVKMIAAVVLPSLIVGAVVLLKEKRLFVKKGKKTPSKT